MAKGHLKGQFTVCLICTVWVSKATTSDSIQETFKQVKMAYKGWTDWLHLQISLVNILELHFGFCNQLQYTIDWICTSFNFMNTDLVMFFLFKKQRGSVANSSLLKTSIISLPLVDVLQKHTSNRYIVALILKRHSTDLQNKTWMG